MLSWPFPLLCKQYWFSLVCPLLATIMWTVLNVSTKSQLPVHWVFYGSMQWPSKKRLVTSASSNCIRMWRHGNCNMHSNSLVHVKKIPTIFQLWEWGFPARGSDCLPSVLQLKWNKSRSDKNGRAYTSTIDRTLLDWSGMGVTATVQCITHSVFTVAMWLRSKIWLVLPTFRQRK